MARPVVCAALTFLLTGLASPVAAQIRGDTIVSGLRNPVAIVADPTDRSTFFIVEQQGLVRVARDGRLLEAPFLDLRGEISSGGERGLLGLVLAPDYAESRRLFVNFTNRDGHTVIARFRTLADDPVRADRDSRFDLQWPDRRRYIEQPFSNHNGGHLAFGPDGYLYVGLGDGGSGGDPLNHAQRPDSLLGKMLRIDVTVDDNDGRGYRIPEDNPFVDRAPVPALEEIWAFGLRNPWRYSFDDWTRGGTSALLIGDVGQNAREEINFEPPGRGGRNYGWRIREGRQPYDERSSAAYEPLTGPIHDYGRAIGASITGGVIYRGSALDPAYEGRYFYADFISGRVFSIGLHLNDEGEAQANEEREHTDRLGGRDTLGMVSSFGHDHDGELLIVNYSAGTVVRITPDLSLVPGSPRATATSTSGRVALQWSAPTEGVEPARYLVERLRDRRVVERIQLERTEIALDASPEDCFRVRAQERSGLSGPPAPTICPTQP
jgi:glucose/arabinose dehydrogenase